MDESVLPPNLIEAVKRNASEREGRSASLDADVDADAAVKSRGQQEANKPDEVDITRLLAGLRRTPRERLDHAVQGARVMERFLNAKRLGPVKRR